jgi:16S rRNA (adenine1518-N6/adenine1519-N6)-dimethyltransferase
MKLTEMKQLLSEREIQLTKSLGQNFLHDGNQLRRIVAAANLSPSDKVLEVGPGLGPLTGMLLAEAGEVLAIEMDQRLIKVLRDRFASRLPPAPDPRLTLVHADALKYLCAEKRDWSAWKLVSNLPYSVGSPILVELATASGPQCLVATLQMEVAQRLAARSGQADYGLLTLLVQLHYQPRTWFKIPASCFFPAPEVDSACIALDRRPVPLLTPALHDPFVRVVKRAFSQRRKMMLKLLKQDYPADRLETAFAEAGLDARIRAESVELEQFVHLVKILHEDKAA